MRWQEKRRNNEASSSSLLLTHGTGANVKFRDLVRKIEQDGWKLDSVRGSHQQYEHPEKRGKVTIAGKPGQDVPPGTLASILKQAGLK